MEKFHFYLFQLFQVCSKHRTEVREHYGNDNNGNQAEAPPIIAVWRVGMA